MTPMIDVIFQLLIFFICTASFQPPEATLPSDVSVAGSSAVNLPMDVELSELDELVVRVEYAEGLPRWSVGFAGQTGAFQPCGGRAELRGLLAEVVRLRADLPVILEVAGEVPIEWAIDTVDLCREVGLTQVQFAVTKSD